ncbi:MAG: nucleoside triphosphate pyrophosphohydrolase [Actinomycetota bacterium]
MKIIGLGPGSLDRLPVSVLALLLDPSTTVIVRTLDHPAATELAQRRPVLTCDDLYAAPTFEQVYEAIAQRVAAAAVKGPTIYAVPGSPLIGELAVPLIRARVTAEIVPGESFVDAVLAAVGYDPLDRGLRVLNGHDLPDPLLIDGPTIVAHLDLPVVLAEVAAALQRVVAEGSQATLVVEAGSGKQRLITTTLGEVDPELAGTRTSMFLDPEPGGVVGVLTTMARLRRECPWDRRQTHQSLVKNLIEESFELVEAIAGLPDSLGAVEDELGDVLLQVLFHAEIASEESGLGIEDVAENLRQKLVRRHPHVFGDVEAKTPEQVKANWEQIKRDERGNAPSSALSGVAAGMPGLERAAKLQRKAAAVGFDWPSVGPVFDKLDEEIGELRRALDDPVRRETELGDVLFTAVNLARHLTIDPELALRRAIGRFIERFKAMEAMGPLEGLTLSQLDQRWEQVKAGGLNSA